MQSLPSPAQLKTVSAVERFPASEPKTKSESTKYLQCPLGFRIVMFIQKNASNTGSNSLCPLAQPVPRLLSFGSNSPVRTSGIHRPDIIKYINLGCTTAWQPIRKSLKRLSVSRRNQHVDLPSPQTHLTLSALYSSFRLAKRD